MRSPVKVIGLVLIVASIVVASFLAGYATCWVGREEVRYPVLDASDAPQEHLRVLWEVWHLIESEFYEADSLEPRELTYGAVRGLVDSLNDPHTTWVEPTGAAVLREDMTGRFEGIGATVDMLDGELTIIAPLPNSPAERAGLRSRDVVLEADGRPLSGMNLLQAVTLIRGPEDTEVQLLVRRQVEGQAQTFAVSVKRARLDLPTVEYEILPGNVAYLKLYEFNARAGREVERALEELLSGSPTGLVLDLRNNPGGLLSEAVSVASEFISGGVILVEKQSEEDAGEAYEADPGGLALETKIVVLVNGFSASASEIVAGAIQDHGRGILIGTPTYGKGSMQLPHTLSDQSSFVVTIARWFTPSGRQIEGQGLAPDILVEVTQEDADSERDPQLDRATQHLLEGR